MRPLTIILMAAVGLTIAACSNHNITFTPTQEATLRVAQEGLHSLVIAAAPDQHIDEAKHNLLATEKALGLLTPNRSPRTNHYAKERKA